MARLRRPAFVGALAVIAVVVLLGAGAQLLRSHQAPASFALSTSQPSGPAAALAGSWTVGPGSQVGYRVKEQFINQPSQTEAVARTSKVTGTLVVAVDGGAIRVSKMKFTVDLASLTSQDNYANYQTYQRDFFIRTIYLETDAFPTATLAVNAFAVTVPASGPVIVDVSGKLTVHGISQPVTAHVHAAGDARQGEVVGSLVVDMRDFGISPPDISFTRAEPMVTIEFDLHLLHRQVTGG